MISAPATPEVEARAERVLADVPDWLWNGERLPVPVEDIADSCFGLLVREAADLSAASGAPALAAGESLSGLLLPARGEIWVNADEALRWPGRRRFTVGHELGHWCMHRARQGTVLCRRPSIRSDDDEEEQPPPPPREEEANAFAAALLMPAQLVRRHCARLERDNAALALLFHTSRGAMWRRLGALGLL
jgi:IrrE N-terminal-like domain